MPDSLQQCLYRGGERGVPASTEGSLSDHHRLRPHRALPGPAQRSLPGGKNITISPNLVATRYLPAVLIYKTFPLPSPSPPHPWNFQFILDDYKFHRKETFFEKMFG